MLSPTLPKPEAYSESVLDRLLASCLFVVFCVLQFTLFYIIVSGDFDQSSSVATQAAFTLLLLGNFLIYFYVVSSRAGFGEIIISYFLTVSFAFCALYQEMTLIFPWLRLHSPDQGLQASFAMALFGVSFFIGGASYARSDRDAVILVGNSRVNRFALFMTLLSFMIFLAVGPQNVLAARYETRDPNYSGSYQLILIGKSILLPAYLFFLLNFRVGTRTQRRKILFPMVFSCILALIWFNPVSSPRFHFIGFVLATLAVLFSLWRPSSTFKAFILICLLLSNYFLFGPLKQLSEAYSNPNDDFLSGMAESIRYYAYRVDFDSYQVSANAIVHMDAYGPNFGTSLVGSFLFFVPRSIWPSKPLGTSLSVHADLGYEYVNLSYPLPMEFFSAGGFIMVILSGFIFGRLFRKLTVRSLGNSRVNCFGASTLLFALLAGYAPIIMRGSLNAVVPQFGLSFIMIGVFWLVARTSLKRP